MVTADLLGVMFVDLDSGINRREVDKKLDGKIWFACGRLEIFNDAKFSALGAELLFSGNEKIRGRSFKLDGDASCSIILQNVVECLELDKILLGKIVQTHRGLRVEGHSRARFVEQKLHVFGALETFLEGAQVLSAFRVLVEEGHRDLGVDEGYVASLYLLHVFNVSRGRRHEHLTVLDRTVVDLGQELVEREVSAKVFEDHRARKVEVVQAQLRVGVGQVGHDRQQLQLRTPLVVGVLALRQLRLGREVGQATDIRGCLKQIRWKHQQVVRAVRRIGKTML